jgi:hypothetical protein
MKKQIQTVVNSLMLAILFHVREEEEEEMEVAAAPKPYTLEGIGREFTKMIKGNKFKLQRLRMEMSPFRAEFM